MKSFRKDGKIRSDVLNYFKHQWSEMEWKHTSTEEAIARKVFSFQSRKGLLIELEKYRSNKWKSHSFFTKGTNHLKISESRATEDWETCIDDVMNKSLGLFGEYLEKGMSLLEVMIVSDNERKT